MTRVADLSVSIATLDRPLALARCVDALLASDPLPAKIVIVDQSQDAATWSAVHQRRAGPVPLHYIYRRQRNASAARNAAIAAATHPVVAITDDDCVPSPDWIGIIERTFASPNAPDALTGKVLPLGPDAPGFYGASLRTSALRTDYCGKVAPWMVGTGGNLAVRRAWLSRVGGYDERLGPGAPGRASEDMDLIYRLLCAGARVRYEPDALVHHERQSHAQRMASRWSYGYGMGAFCATWLRRGDLYVVRLISGWLVGQCFMLARAAVQRQWVQVRMRALSVWGALAGLACGWGMPNGRATANPDVRGGS